MTNNQSVLSHYEEWELAQVAARDRVSECARELGVLPQTLEYVRGLRGLYRCVYPLSTWALTPERRRAVGVSLTCHFIGIKLLDDLVDDDSGADRFDLGALSLQLQTAATLDLLSFCDAELLAVMNAKFQEISRGQLKCKRRPANDLASWLSYAGDYGARFFSMYGRIGALAAGLDSNAASVPESFAWSIGLIFTMADDLTDYHRYGERTGNLGAILLGGGLTVPELTATIEQQRALAHEALRNRPPVMDWHRMLDEHANDLRDRLIPLLLAEKREATD